MNSQHTPDNQRSQNTIFKQRLVLKKGHKWTVSTPSNQCNESKATMFWPRRKENLVFWKQLTSTQKESNTSKKISARQKRAEKQYTQTWGNRDPHKQQAQQSNLSKAITKIPNRTNCKTNTWTAERKHLRMKNSNKTNSKEDCKQCKESHSRKKAASKAGDMEPWTSGKKSWPTEKKQYILSRTRLTSQHKGNE